MSDLVTLYRLRRAGILMPRICLGVSRSEHLELAVLATIFKMETGGGVNIYGHDPVRNPIKSPAGGSLKVNRANYLQYKHYRILGYGMQGVGPTQLTWYSYQDLADKLGGCYNPTHNARVAAQHIKALIHKYGTWGGFRAYNGAGAAATQYANQATAILQHTRWQLSGSNFSLMSAHDDPGTGDPGSGSPDPAAVGTHDEMYVPFDYETGDPIDLEQNNGRGH